MNCGDKHGFAVVRRLVLAPVFVKMKCPLTTLFLLFLATTAHGQAISQLFCLRL